MNCEICNNQIDDRQVLLPCLHAFCEKCFASPTCTICQEPHNNKLTLVVKLFPIPDIRVVLKSLGFKYVAIEKSNKLFESAEKCSACRSYHGVPYDCFVIESAQVTTRTLCSVCSSLRFDDETNRLQGNAKVFFDTIENRSRSRTLPANYELLQLYFNKTATEAVQITAEIFSNFEKRDVISENDCGRLLNLIQDCQPTGLSNVFLDQIIKIVGPHCLCWHLVPILKGNPKCFVQGAFGYMFEGDNRSLNLTLIAYFLYYMRKQTMHLFSWMPTDYPDNSQYVFEAILQKIKN